MTLQLTISKLACSACISTVTQAIQSVDPTATVQADIKTKRVEVHTHASAMAIKDAISSVGYPST